MLLVSTWLPRMSVHVGRLKVGKHKDTTLQICGVVQTMPFCARQDVLRKTCFVSFFFAG
jgi:hypothetical protein